MVCFFFQTAQKMCALSCAVRGGLLVAMGIGFGEGLLVYYCARIANAPPLPRPLIYNYYF